MDQGKKESNEKAFRHQYQNDSNQNFSNNSVNFNMFLVFNILFNIHDDVFFVMFSEPL